MNRGIHGYGEPSGDVLFADIKSVSRKSDQRIQDGAPSNLVPVEPVIQMARADGIFGEKQ